MKTPMSIAAALLLLAGSAAAFAASAIPDPNGAAPDTSALPAAAPTEVDTATFVKTVPSANAFEVESSKLAEEKAPAADVKDFAGLMIKDHTRAGKDFEAALARRLTTGSITAAPGLSAEDQARLDELKGLSGEAFQGRYIALQMQAHKDAVAMFSAYANSGDDPALKEFAKKTLPTLQMHEMHVKDVAAAHQG